MAFVSHFIQLNANVDESNASANAPISGQSSASANAALALANAFEHKSDLDNVFRVLYHESPAQLVVIADVPETHARQHRTERE